jgi:PIN domain nuclease of toxin-antitoxin system
MPIKDFFYAIANIPGIRVEPLSIDAAAQVHDMHDVVHGDPADRMIIATAQVIKASILTRDCKIIEYCRGGLLALKE